MRLPASVKLIEPRPCALYHDTAHESQYYHGWHYCTWCRNDTHNTCVCTLIFTWKHTLAVDAIIIVMITDHECEYWLEGAGMQNKNNFLTCKSVRVKNFLTFESFQKNIPSDMINIIWIRLYNTRQQHNIPS